MWCLFSLVSEFHNETSARSAVKLELELEYRIQMEERSLESELCSRQCSIAPFRCIVLAGLARWSAASQLYSSILQLERTAGLFYFFTRMIR